MLFNSINFAIFLPIVFALYWGLANKKISYQNLLLLLASYFFYACWDWRFLFLLVFSTGLDYFTGIKIFESRSDGSRKFWLWSSVITNLGFLGIFKYYNFFTESFAEGLKSIGLNANISTLEIILPVGISFYTFHGLSYIIDIYKGRIEPERNVVNYSLFVSYFPLLVAGPIERATHLLPQIKARRQFSYEKAMDGIYQICWGLCKKLIIADNCAHYANEIFDNHESMDSFTLILGAVYFAFQIYGDFAGYSDIALGTSKLFGIDLLRNFNYPYFSRDIAEFWRRWHISLSTWFRDYLYIPLGGSRATLAIKIRNTFIIFIVSGFWHGANWTFLVWGALHAVFFLPLLLTNNNRKHMDIVAKGRALPTIREFGGILLTFVLTTFAWIFFRANSVGDAFGYIRGILNFDFEIQYMSFNRYAPEFLLPVLLFLLVEWNCREFEHPVQGKYRTAKVVAVITAILLFGSFSNVSDFIYFQF